MIFCLSVFIFLNMVGRFEVQDVRKNIALTYHSPQNNLSADALKIIAGEFKGLWADYLLLEIGAFIGSNQKATPEDWIYIRHTFDQCYALDPYFQQTYLFVQGNLPWQPRMVNETIGFLTLSKKHRPWDWYPGNYMAFDYYYFLNDYNRASQEMLEAAKVKNAPVYLAVLGARFAHKSRQNEAAIIILRKMIENEELADSDRSELQQRLTALEGTWLLQKAVDQYREKHQHYPSALEALLHEKLINTIPRNPYADRYFYDSITGRVAFDQVK